MIIIIYERGIHPFDREISRVKFGDLITLDNIITAIAYCFLFYRLM